MAGTPPYTFQVVDGLIGLPPGVTLSSGGTFSGVPTTVNFNRFFVRVTDAAGRSATSEYLIMVDPPWEPSALPSAQIGLPYNARVLRSGLQIPFPVELASGTLPPGLQLNSNGTITGEPAAAAGTYGFAVRPVQPPQVESFRTITVTGSATQGQNPPEMTGGALPEGRRGVAYGYQVQAFSGVPPYQFSIVQGNLPPGIGFSPWGSLAGVPTLPGAYSFTVRASGNNGASSDAGFTLNIGESGLNLSGGQLPNATISRPYFAQFTATGGVPPLRYSLHGSVVLPPNLQFESNGRLSGTPNTGGTFDLLVQVADAANGFASARYTLQIVRPNFRITDARLPNARQGDVYSHQLATADGAAPYRFDLLQGSALPRGLTISPAGLISGTPLEAGQFAFTVTSIDAQNFTASAALTLTVAAPRLSISTTSLPAPAVGQSYRQGLTAIGGVPPYQYSVLLGTLPTGLRLVPETGVIEGIPTAPGTSTFTVRVTDGASQAADQAFTLNVAAPRPLSMSASSLSVASLYANFTGKLQVEGGREPLQFAVTAGSLPPGLSLDRSSGTLQGSPQRSGNYAFTIQVRDADAASAVARFELSIPRPLNLPPASTARDYSAPLASLLPGAPPGLTVNPNTFMPLPPGLNVAADGRLAGRPTLPGVYTFSLRSASGAEYAVELLVESDGFQITTFAPPPARQNAPYNFTLLAENGQGFSRWRVRDGALPPGLGLDPIVGRLEGTPLTNGAFRFTAEAIDQASRSALRQYVLYVGAANLPQLAAITSAASYAGGGVAPGELLTLFGQPLDADTRVYFDGQAAPMIYSFPTQASAVAPFSLKDRTFTQVSVERQGVERQGIVSMPFTMKVLPAKPGLFTIDGSGAGPGAILNQNGSVNLESNPAAPNSVVVLYATGGGSMSPEGIDGQAAVAASSLTLPARVEVNGNPATVLYAGNAPGLLHGVIQVNVQLPVGLPRGANSVLLYVGQQRSAAGVTLWVE